MPDLEGVIDVLGEVVGEIVVWNGGCGKLRGTSGRFSFDGSSIGALDMSFKDTRLNDGLDGSNVTGDLVNSSGMVLSATDLIEVGVPAFDDGSLVGEMDLARSERWSDRYPSVNTVCDKCRGIY